MTFTLQQIFYYVSLVLVIFIPGYFLLMAIFGKEKSLSAFEKLISSIGISIVVMDFLMISMAKMNIPLTRVSLVSGIFLFSLLCYAIYKFKKSQKNSYIDTSSRIISPLSKKQFAVFVMLLAITVFIRTVSLKNTIHPSATDLAHHTYWIKLIVQSEKLPEYEKRDVIKTGENHSISNPVKIDDFIVGEHLVPAAIMAISGHNPISPHLSITLLLISLSGLMAIFILTQAIFCNFKWGNSAAIFSLALSGPVFAISSTQSNFVSGGVIGNLIGNLLIPLALYFYVRALQEKNKAFLSLAFLLTFGLAYTHHLSTLVFATILIGFILSLFLSDIRKFAEDMKILLRMIMSPGIVLLILSFFIFFFLVYTPGYIENSAVKTILGAPTRSTKEGLPLQKIIDLVGSSRAALGVFGIAMLIFFRKKLRRPSALLFGWTVLVFIMSWEPELINLNIPSVRVANYMVFPLIIAASFTLAWIFHETVAKTSNSHSIKSSWAISIFFLFLAFSFSAGYKDNSDAFKTSSNVRSSLLTFNASAYLADRIENNDVILKDHNYISSDAWIKLFFMRDYNFPLTRSFFFRYTDYPNREQCTNNIISKPNTEEGKNCINQLGIDFVMVNPSIDSAQFEKNKSFSSIYSSDTIRIFYKK